MGGAADLAGRVAELRAVSDLLSGEGEPAAMLIVGEAGVGKSRLVAAAADAITEVGVVVATGWCLPTSEGVPFLPLTDVLSTLEKVDGGRLLNDALAECPAFVRAEVGRLLPDLAVPTEWSGSEGPNEGWRKRQFFEALRRAFAGFADQRAVAVVVEDVHWADTSTVELLDYLLSPGRAMGVRFVLTCRSEEPVGPTVAAWVDRLHRNPRVARLDLRPLSEAETGEQIGLMLGAPPPRRLAAEVYARSEGNAFFTEQLVAAGEANHLLPAGLTSLLLFRTGEVTGVASEILAALAVAARPLDEVTVALLCQRPDREVRVALRELLERRLLRRPDDAGRHQLRHALLGEAISSELLPSERAELHARVADTLAASGDSSLAAQIAEHYGASAQISDELRWRAVAAHEAETKYASREAVIHLQRVIALWDLVPSPEELTGWDLARVYLRAFTELVNAGSFEAAAALAEQALARLGAEASPETAVSLYRAVGLARSATSHEAGVAAMRTAIQVGKRIPPTSDYVRCEREYAGRLADQGMFAESREHLNTALQAAKTVGDLSEQKLMLVELAWLSVAQGDVAAALDGLDNATQIVLEPENPNVEAWASIGHADVLLQLGDLERAADIAVEGIALAERGGSSLSFRTHTLRCVACEALVELGDLTRAAAIVDPFTNELPSGDTLDIHAARAALDVRRGNHEAAATYWTDNQQLLGKVASLERRRWFASWHLEYDVWSSNPISSLPDVLAVLEQLVGTDASRLTGPLFVLAARACADAADLARATGDPDNLRAALQTATGVSKLRDSAAVDPFADHPTPATTTADRRTWNAQWQRLYGKSDAVTWGQAATAWDALTRPHRAAYARWRQAEALLADPAGRPAAADVLRTAARQAAQHVPLSIAIHDLARRARIDLSPPGPVVPPEQHAPIAFGLTERELAVLRLLGEGKTNSEIGAVLYISRKTASVHVTNILRKLGVGTRVQAAALAERADLLQGG
jgi:DNA-binding CsgD family transcriptional regulator/tetratricopeptide (TPR) repeat protein